MWKFLGAGGLTAGLTAGLAGGLLVLAGCESPDPLARARADCANAGLAAPARIAACTTLIDTGALGDGDRSDALAQRGDAQGAAGRVTAALRDYDAALAANPENPRAALGRAGVLIGSGQLDAAEPLLRRVLERGELAATAQFLAGEIALRRGADDAAIGHFDAALAAEPRHARALAGRASAKQALENYDGALADYTAALAIDQRLAPALAGRCWTRILRGDEDDAPALADAQGAVESDPRDVNGQLCLGLLHLRASRWAQAKAAYDAALEVEAGNPAALFGRGLARRRGGDGAGREDMNQARDFSPNIGAAFDRLGVKTY